MFGPQGNLPSTLSHDFSRVPKAEIQRSTFNRDHGLKTTFDSGYLVPIFYDEALPGDTFNLSAHGFGRLATPLHPFMDNLYIETFFFAVPNRLLWDNWQKFMGEQTNPGDSTDYLVPTTSGTVANSTLYDYFGVPTQVATEWNNWSGRAYNLIYNEWFRDENLQDSVTVDKGDGPDTITDYTMLKRGKRKDYFTSALPWPQKGDAVTLPLGSTAPIASGVSFDGTNSAGNNPTILNPSTGNYHSLASTHATVYANSGTALATSSLYADLTDAAAATINQLREAFQIQKLYERDARGGTRYTEIIQSHFGVTSPDARLQRPEYLGGGKDLINVNPVSQLSSTDATSPLGSMGGYATTGFTGHKFSKSFTEHSVILGMACVFADLTYQQGLPRHFSRSTRFDYYFPVLAHLGEQAILNKEIYTQGTSDDDLAWGYQERWAEYRYKPSWLSGQMRSNDAITLDTWHLAQDFASVPSLNASFIEENPPVSRVIAVPSEPDMLLDMYFKLNCTRPMPTYSVPGLVDHF
jgi:hypothetical protein